MDAFRALPIEECGEPLVAIPAGSLLRTSPHPYANLGAPYGDCSPWATRSGILERVEAALKTLRKQRPDWGILLFDAYRPNTVQRFMVEYEFRKLSGGEPPGAMTEPERGALWEQVFRIWSEPSDDPASPPPHSTGAALDLTLVDERGREVWMGSPIDENSERSNPDYFSERDRLAHTNRQLLLEIMTAAGFRRHPFEWWHFSHGDQMWAWLVNRERSGSMATARYGRADLLPG